MVPGMPSIHPTALVADGARLADDVVIGPYCVIEDGVEIGSGTSVGAHSVIYSGTRIGRDNRIHAHVILGDVPQHSAFKPGTRSHLVIGDGNSIRELVTMHRALYSEAATIIGNNGLFMSESHVAHDCIIGNHVVLTTHSAFGGHVEVGDHAVIGGIVGIHQFCRIGAYAIIAAATLVRKDVLPFTMLGGSPARHYRLNTIGLRRNGISGERYRAIERAFRQLRAGDECEFSGTAELDYLQQWLAQPSKRGLSGFLHAERRGRAVDDD